MGDTAQLGRSLSEVEEFCRASGLNAWLERFAFEHYIYRGLQDAGFDDVTIRRIPEHALTIATGTCSLQNEAEHENSTVSRILGCLRAEGLNPEPDLLSVRVTDRVVTVKVAILEPQEQQGTGE
jgi:hypothetical protein